MGYGQIVGGMKQSAAAKRRGSGSRVVSKYRAERDAITAKAETFEAVGQAAVSLHKGYSEGQSQWANLEEGAAELGLEEQIAEKRAGAGRWEKWTGPSKKTLDEMVTGDAVDGKQLEVSYGELKTMGKIKRTAGSRYLKTMDPTTGEYKDVKDSGWGETKDVPVGETPETAAAKDTGKKSYSNFPIAESLMNKTGETLGNIQGSLTDWWSKKGDAGATTETATPELKLSQSEVNQSEINAKAFEDAEARKRIEDKKIYDAARITQGLDKPPVIEQSEEDYIKGELSSSGEPGAVDQYEKDKAAGLHTEQSPADKIYKELGIDINTSATSDVVNKGAGTVTPKQTRGQAFRAAYDAGESSFMYEGKSYTTEMAEPPPEENTNPLTGLISPLGDDDEKYLGQGPGF